MKLNLNIQDDAELRSEVRKIIKGQVVGLVRDEIKSIIIEVLSTNDKRLTADRLEQIAIQEIKNHVSASVNEGSWGNDRKKLERLVKAEVRKIVEEKSDDVRFLLEKEIGKFVKDEVSRLIGDEVQKAVKNYIASALAK